MQVSLLVAAFYLGLTVLQAGLLTNFLSHSVISGFTSGASIIIATTQARPRAQRSCLPLQPGCQVGFLTP